MRLLAPDNSLELAYPGVSTGLYPLPVDACADPETLLKYGLTVQPLRTLSTAPFVITRSSIHSSNVESKGYSHVSQ